MKDIIILLTIAIVLLATIDLCDNKAKICELKKSNEFKHELITSYEAYYNATETLLDDLDDKYDWVDSFDPQEYYLAKEKLDSLYATQL